MQRYSTAIFSFRDTYMALPGDMTNATSFWGKNETVCSTHSGTNAGANGTCNGNGNGTVELSATASVTAENHQFWRQLALSGLIEGSYTGINGSAGNNGSGISGQNVPTSKISNTRWIAYYYDNDPAYFNNFFALGYTTNSLRLQGGTSGAAVAIFKPEELWGIDIKVDDGKPGRGKLTSNYNNSCTTASLQTDLDAAYALSSTSIACYTATYGAF